MKSTDKELFACEQFNAKHASAQLKHEQRYARQAKLARQAIDDCKQEAEDKRADDAAFWKWFYIFIHAVAVLLVLVTLYKSWGQ